jgi:LAGLIDADG-like domain
MSRVARSVDFFRVWSADMAYVLGYWWADGNMRIKKNTGAFEISIASNDCELLETIGRVIGEKYYLKKVSSLSNTYVMAFCSRQMYQDLESLGATPRKSRTIGFPPVPTQYLPHFIRGVVDGDGTLSWNGDRPIIQIYSGSTEFLDGLAQVVERETGIPAPLRQKNRDNWVIKWSTTRAKCLAGWLYEINSGLALPRKAAIAKDILMWQPRKRPEQGTITDAMRFHFPDYLES